MSQSIYRKPLVPKRMNRQSGNPSLVKIMEPEILVHKSIFHVAGQDYEVAVYTRPDGAHVAKTSFSPVDVIVNDGRSLDDVLAKHRRVLPLAVNSRQILRELERS
jgi:hypothetical protein